MKNIILIAFGIIFPLQLVYSQTYSLKKELNEATQAELLSLSKQLFEPESPLEFNFTTFDLVPTFEDLEDQIQYNEAYRKQIEEALTKNPKDPMLWNNLGNYYNEINDTQNAKESFERAYNFLKREDFKKDSARYHSLRGILLLNQGKEGSIEALERAFQINPNDSLARTFYPIMLIQNQEFDKAEKHILEAYKKSGKNEKILWFTLFSIIDLISQMYDQQSRMETDPTFIKAEQRQLDYYQFSDLSKIESMYQKHKGIQTFENAKLMIDYTAIFFKFTLIENENQLYSALTKNDVKRLIEIQKELVSMENLDKMNEFSRLKMLGYVSFALNDLENAEIYFKRSIEIFPLSKANDSFSPKQCEAMILNITETQKDYVKMKTLYEQQLHRDTVNVPIDLFINLAKSELQLDNYDAAYAWAMKGYAVSTDNFEVLRLLAHHYFYKRNNIRIDFYMKSASQNGSNLSEEYNLYMQMIIYYVSFGLPDKAYKSIEEYKQMYPNEKCEFCDKIEQKYILVSP